MRNSTRKYCGCTSMRILNKSAKVISHFGSNHLMFLPKCAFRKPETLKMLIILVANQMELISYNSIEAALRLANSAE